MDTIALPSASSAGEALVSGLLTNLIGKCVPAPNLDRLSLSPSNTNVEDFSARKISQSSSGSPNSFQDSGVDCKTGSEAEEDPEIEEYRREGCRQALFIPESSPKSSALTRPDSPAPAPLRPVWNAPQLTGPRRQGALPRTNLGLVDCDALYPCTKTNPCLLDKYLLAEKLIRDKEYRAHLKTLMTAGNRPKGHRAHHSGYY